KIATLSERAEHFPRPTPAVPAPPREAEMSLLIEGPRGRLSLVAGKEPLTIGSAPGSQVLLDDDTGQVAREHARVWSSDGKLMFHQLSQDHPSLMAGNPVGWVGLKPGDQVEIGPYRLKVE